jgi:hypothetical protein
MKEKQYIMLATKSFFTFMFKRKKIRDECAAMRRSERVCLPRRAHILPLTFCFHQIIHLIHFNPNASQSLNLSLQLLQISDLNIKFSLRPEFLNNHIYDPYQCSAIFFLKFTQK